AEDDRRLRRGSAGTTGARGWRRTGKARSTGTRRGTAGTRPRARHRAHAGTSAGSATPCRRCARSTARATATRSAESAAGATDVQATDVALADGRIPVALDLASLRVGGDAVVHAVVDQHIGVGTT